MKALTGSSSILWNPFRDSSATFFTMGGALDVFDQISQVLYNEDEDQFQIQPTPIGSYSQLVIVSELSAQDDSNLCDSGIAGDFLALSSSSSSSSSNSSDTAGSSARSKRSYENYTTSSPSPPASITNSAPPCEEPITHKKKKRKTSPATVLAKFEQQQQDAPTTTHHYNKWEERLQDLLHFKLTYGHCRVPNVHPENIHLAQWVKRQRYQYKLKMDGKHSTLTDERQQTLDCVGFVWDAHEAMWMERWNQLKEFFLRQGHSNVPTNYPPNQHLAIWVKCQRRQHKLYLTGGRSNMTVEREQMLDSLNFNWNPRNLK